MLDILMQLEKFLNKYFQTNDAAWVWDAQTLIRRTRKNIEDGYIANDSGVEAGTSSPDERTPI